MRNWHIPLEELVKKIEYREEGGYLLAFIDGTEIGAADLYMSQKAIEEWKRALIISITPFSSTVQLRTACGCTQHIELPEPGMKTWLMPLEVPPSIPALTLKSMVRAFEFHGEQSELGFRMFREKV